MFYVLNNIRHYYSVPSSVSVENFVVTIQLFSLVLF